MGNRLPMTLSISCSQILLAYHLLMENTKLPMLMQLSSKRKGKTTHVTVSAFPRFR
ncbi:hypothetical protein T03_11338 [Trichinella britovi]|uniref:Uncharacterized protein n=1 Tax=Trichinella britovi TaxID=45882 RepID=A0A0V1C4L7_TRIBR|nr:hypothetical protein T03_11338 [Trichinella britovi]